MKRRRHTPEQVVRKLREGDRMLNEGKDLVEVLRHLEVSESSWARWRAQYGGSSPPGEELRRQRDDSAGARWTSEPDHDRAAPPARIHPADVLHRRTRPDGARGPVRIISRARDLVTGADGRTSPVGVAGLLVSLDPAQSVATIECDPARPELEAMVRRPAGPGFRAVAAGAVPEERRQTTLLYLLLDNRSGLPGHHRHRGDAAGAAVRGVPGGGGESGSPRRPRSERVARACAVRLRRHLDVHAPERLAA